jgi:hypothetical protein
LNQEDINGLNRSTTCNEIEAAIVSQKKKSSELDGFTAEFYETLKKELISSPLKLFYEIEGEGTQPKTFYEVSYYTHPQTRQGHTTKGNCRPISLMNLDTKALNKVLEN